MDLAIKLNGYFHVFFKFNSDHEKYMVLAIKLNG